MKHQRSVAKTRLEIPISKLKQIKHIRHARVSTKTTPKTNHKRFKNPNENTSKFLMRKDQNHKRLAHTRSVA